jgi:hypothetical protein
MTRQIIDVDIFLKRGHKGAKIAYFSNFSQDGAMTQKCHNLRIGMGLSIGVSSARDIIKRAGY